MVEAGVLVGHLDLGPLRAARRVRVPDLRVGDVATLLVVDARATGDQHLAVGHDRRGRPVAAVLHRVGRGDHRVGGAAGDVDGDAGAGAGRAAAVGPVAATDLQDLAGAVHRGGRRGADRVAEGALVAGAVAEGAAQGQGAVTRGVQLGHLRAGDVEDVAVGRCHEGARVPPAVLVRPVAVAAVSVGRGAGGAVEQLPRVALRGVVELGGEDSGAAGAAAQRSTLDDDGAVGQRGARRVPAREVHRGLVLEARAGAVARDADRGVVGRVATEAVVTADGEGRASVRHLDLHGAEEVGVGRVGDDPETTLATVRTTFGSQTSISVWPPWVTQSLPL